MNVRKLFEGSEYGKVVEMLLGKELTDPNEYLALGLSYYQLGKRNKALVTFKRMLQRYPNHQDALFNLTETYRSLRKWRDTKGYGLQYLRFDPNNWVINGSLADVYIFEGHYDKALQHLRLALQSASQKDLSYLKHKTDYLKERIENARQMEKFAFICAFGLDNFIDDLIAGLSDEYWVRKFVVQANNQREIFSAIDWADIVWLEWANEETIVGTNYSGVEKKHVLVRLHSYEAFTGMPHKINWNVVERLIFVAPHVREILKTTLPDIEKMAKTEIIYNGIDLSKTPFKERKAGYNIAWVGYINYKKNPPMMMQVMERLVRVDPRYQLHVAGICQDLRYEVYLKYMVKEMKLENNVVFHGWVDDMDEWWEDKNFLLSTSIHEGHPYNIMEAMAIGIKPVIHEFFGARELYKGKWLFRTIDEAVDIIRNHSYDSSGCLEYLKEKGWTLEHQINMIRKVIGNL